MRKTQVPWRKTMQTWALSIAILVTAGLVGLTIWLEVDPPDTSISTAAPVFVQYQGQVQADRPLVIRNSGGDVAVYVPCCSLGIGGTIELVMETPDLFSEPERERVWQRPRVIELQVTSTAGEVIPNAYSSTPLEVCFVLNEAEWHAYRQAPENYQIQYYDDLHRPFSWRGYSTYAFEERHSLCTQTNRARLMALALKGDAIPLTGGGNSP
jgi:hypothetical protein